MIPLLSLQEAKDHLHLVGTRYDGDVSLKIMQASAVIFDYLKLDETSPMSFPWGTADVPFNVQAACMLVLGDLWWHREGSAPGTLNPPNPLSQAVKDLLNRKHRKTMA